jgi:hypothetical protein
MAVRKIKMPNIQNLAANAHASISFPLGVTYEKLAFDLGTTGLLKSSITNIVLRLNNKEFQRWASAADLDAYNAYKGNLTSNARFLFIDFTERLAKTEVAMKLGTVAACDAAGVQSFTLEFDVGAWTVTGGIAPSLAAEVSEPSSNRLIQRVQFQQKGMSGALTDQIYLPFGQQGYQLKRILFKHVNLSSVRVRRDGADILEDLSIALANAIEQDCGRTPQAGYHVSDFMSDTLASNALNTGLLQTGVDANGKPVLTPVQNLDIRLTTSAADVITFYTDGFAANNQL